MIEMEYTQTAVTTHRKEQAFRENVILQTTFRALWLH